MRCVDIGRIQKLCLWLLFVCSFSAIPVRGQRTIHVPTDEPTIQAGINAAQAGDTVLVAPGTYNENIDFQGKGITVTSGASSYSEAAATIINGANSGPVVKLVTGEPATALLNGFTIQGGFANNGTQDVAAGVVILGSSASVANNTIQGNIGCGVIVGASASPTITANDIRRNLTADTHAKQKNVCYGNSAGAGVVISGAATVVLNSNIIEENSTYLPDGSVPTGEQIDCGGVCILEAQKVVFFNNTIRNNASAGVGGINDADLPGEELILIQNLFYTDQKLPGQADANVSIATVSLSPQQLIAINNTFEELEIGSNYTPESIIANNVVGELNCNYVPQPPQISHNDLYLPSLKVSGVSYQCPLGPGNLTSAPQFLNPAQGDFHVQRSSPVIAAGDINAPQIPPTDLDGKNRTVCGTIDMGVYEKHPAPATAVTSSVNPSVGGTAVTFSATVPGNCNVPTGTVTFFDGTNALGTETLSGGATASLTTSSLTVGTHTITVGYQGDFNFDPSTSAPLVQVVTGYPTTTTLSVSPNPGSAFGSLMLSTAVTSGVGVPSGTVTFTAGATVLGTVTLNANGQAAITISSLGAGTYSIVASYNATTEFAGSSSAAVNETVAGAASITSLTAAPNPALVGQTVTFTATVNAAQGSSVPSGSVTFRDGSASLGTVALGPSGTASLNTDGLAAGTHTLTAAYGGDANFSPSSATIVQRVTAIGTATTLTASPNPAGTVQTVTLTATVAPATASVPVSGTLTFLDGGLPIGTSVLNSAGTATLSTSTLAPGTHNLTASYSGTGNLSASTSAVFVETIIASSFNLSLTPSTLTLKAGQSGSVSVQLGSVGNYVGTLALGNGPLPAYITGSLSSPSVALAANGNASATLSLTAPITAATSHWPGNSNQGHVLWAGAAMFFLSPVLGWRRRRSASLVLVLCAGTFLLGLSGCGNVGYAIHTVAPGTYNIPITAEDASGIKRTSSFALVITP